MGLLVPALELLGHLLGFRRTFTEVITFPCLLNAATSWPIQAKHLETVGTHNEQVPCPVLCKYIVIVYNGIVDPSDVVNVRQIFFLTSISLIEAVNCSFPISAAAESWLRYSPLGTFTYPPFSLHFSGRIMKSCV